MNQIAAFDRKVGVARQPDAQEQIAAFSAAIAAPLIISAFRRLRTPLWGWVKSARSIPISAELVVFFPFFRVAQYLVRFVDLLKFFLGGLLVLSNVGVVFARQLAKGAANLVFAGRLRHAERLVVISELYGHSPSNLCLRSIRATF